MSKVNYTIFSFDPGSVSGLTIHPVEIGLASVVLNETKVLNATATQTIRWMWFANDFRVIGTTQSHGVFTLVDIQPLPGNSIVQTDY